MRRRVRIGPPVPPTRRTMRPCGPPAQASIGSERAASFDHLVGGGEQHLGDLDAERLGSLQVDDRDELRRLLDRDVAGFAPFRILSTKVAARRDMGT